MPGRGDFRALGDAEDNRRRGKVVTYRAKGTVCGACALKPRCTTNKNGRSLRRGPGDGHIDLVRAYMETEPYRKAIGSARYGSSLCSPRASCGTGCVGSGRERLRRPTPNP